MSLWRRTVGALVLVGMLSGCGGPDASTPQSAALAFFNAVQAKEQDTLRELAHPEVKQWFNLLCSSTPSDCIEAELHNPPGEIEGTPEAVVISEDGASAHIALRHQFAGAGIRCSNYRLELRDKAWLVESVNGYSQCDPEMTATASAQQAVAEATQEAYYSTATADASDRMQAQTATVEAKFAAATATQAALPTAIPERFMTARQAFLAAGIEAKAQSWSGDARLVEVAFNPDYREVDEEMIALDGTSRVWTFRYASPSLQKMMTLFTQDGLLVEQSDNSTADYKKLFAGKSEIQSIDPQLLLDSDQALTIARENGLELTSMKGVRIYLTTIPDSASKPYQQPVAYWNVYKNNFISSDELAFRADTGEIEYNEVGPTGSPGALPTPLAPVTSGVPTPLPVPTPTLGGSTGGTPDNEATKQAFLEHFAGNGLRPEDVLAEGEYVRAIAAEAGAITFYKREGSDWRLLVAGSFFDPEALQALGIPEPLWPTTDQ